MYRIEEIIAGIYTRRLCVEDRKKITACKNQNRGKRGPMVIYSQKAGAFLHVLVSRIVLACLPYLELDLPSNGD